MGASANLGGNGPASPSGHSMLTWLAVVIAAITAAVGMVAFYRRRPAHARPTGTR